MTVYLVVHGMPYDAMPADRVFLTRESAEAYIVEHEAEYNWSGYSEIIPATLESN